MKPWGGGGGGGGMMVYDYVILHGISCEVGFVIIPLSFFYVGIRLLMEMMS